MTIVFQLHLNEVVCGDFVNRGQVMALFAINKDTLRAFKAFQSSIPARYRELMQLIAVDRFAARFEGRGLLKVLRFAGLLGPAPPSGDPYAALSSDKYVFSLISDAKRRMYRGHIAEVYNAFEKLIGLPYSEYVGEEEVYELDMRAIVARIFGGRLLSAWDLAVTVMHCRWNGLGCYRWVDDMEKELYALEPLAKQEVCLVLGERCANQ